MPAYAHSEGLRRQYPDIVRVRLTFREARRITKLLAVEYGFPLRKVRHLPVQARRTLGRFNVSRGIAEYRDEVSLMTVLHEVAHAIDWMRNRSRIVTYTRTGQCRRLFHGPTHRQITSELVRYVRRQGWDHEAPAPVRIAFPINVPVRHAA